jgi:hypothetical protein
VGCLYADCVSACKATEAAGPFLETVAGLTSRAIASRRRPEEKPAAVSAPAGQLAVVSPADRAALVLRLLRGESAESVAATAGVSIADLEEWRRAFLEGAVKGLA